MKSYAGFINIIHKEFIMNKYLYIIFFIFIFTAGLISSQSVDVNAKLEITNITGEKIVLFHDRISEKYMLGSIEIGETGYFGFEENKPYVIMAIIYSEYEKLDLLQSKITPGFAELIYYDSKGDPIQLQIGKIEKGNYEATAGKGKISFINLSNHWIELHKGHAKGNLLGAVSPKFKTSITLNAGGYDIYPVYYTPVYDISPSGNKEIIAYTKQVLKSGINTIRIDDGKLYNYVLKSNNDELNSNIAYLYITNYSDKGYRVVNGVELLKTGTSKNILNPDESLMFWLDTQIYKKLQLNSSGSGKSQTIEIPKINAKQNRVYEIKVTSDYEAVLDKKEGITLNDFLNRYN